MDHIGGTGALLGQCMRGTVVIVALGTGTFCVGLSGTRVGLSWTEYHFDRVVVDRMELGQIRGGLSCTGAYFSTSFEDFSRHSLVHNALFS
jgi:hypothetical protein